MTTKKIAYCLCKKSENGYNCEIDLDLRTLAVPDANDACNSIIFIRSPFLFAHLWYVATNALSGSISPALDFRRTKVHFSILLSRKS